MAHEAASKAGAGHLDKGALDAITLSRERVGLVVRKEIRARVNLQPRAFRTSASSRCRRGPGQPLSYSGLQITGFGVVLSVGGVKLISPRCRGQ